MSQDIVKAFTVNKARVQTGRDVLGWVDLVRLANFGADARVMVTVRESGSALSSVRDVAPDARVPVTVGMVVEVRARA